MGYTSRFDPLIPEPELKPPPKKSRRKPAAALKPASDNPVARVALTSLQTALLDREFDFWVPEKYAESAQPGVRVKVPFRGQPMDGFIVARLSASDHNGELAYLKTVVSPEPVLAPAAYALVKAVAAYYAGTTADVLRFAIPPRHARAEAGADPVIAGLTRNLAAWGQPVTAVPAQWQGLWHQYLGGQQFLDYLTALTAQASDAVGSDQPPATGKYVWTPLPGLAPPIPPAQVPDLPLWAAEIASAAATVIAQGRDVVIVAPDVRDVERLMAALARVGLADVAVQLVSEDGPELRYRSFLTAARGQARVIVGTRAAAFAPVKNPGLLVLWGDGEDTLIEPQTPYYHAREVLLIRSELEQVPLLIGGIGREVTTQMWLTDRIATELAPTRSTLRARAPRVRHLDQTALAAESHPGRIPSAAWRVIHDALARGPVLVQVPRSGYVPALACANCGQRARCLRCHGVLQRLSHDAAPGYETAAAQPPTCQTCGQTAPWRCPNCQAIKLRSAVVGAARTAEELGRAFPGTRVITSSADSAAGVRSNIPAESALVIATPGAEPVAQGGYAAAVLLDAAATSSHLGLDAEVHALRRWLAPASLVVPGRMGGQVVLVGEAAPGAAQALVLLEPAWFADRQLDERRELGLPPVTRAAAIIGDDYAVAAVTAQLGEADAEVFGPIPMPESDDAAGAALLVEPKERTLIRVPRAAGSALAQQLKAILVTRAAKREPGAIKVQLDPAELI